MYREYLAAGFAVLLLTSVVGGVLAIAPAESGMTGAASQEAATCQYDRVFDRTVDSLVSVRTESGQGSGFVVATAGGEPNENVTLGALPGDVGTVANGSLLVTNAHVVGTAGEVTIQFNEGEYRTGSVVGRSRYADLAVVRVPDTPGYVGALEVAETDPQRGVGVAALGNPFGLEKTITHGIVSGLNRSMPTDRGFTIPNVLQTDAPISPGNSGGPLVTCDATVVGVNTAGIGQPQAENIAFAVSASVVQEVVPELVRSGEFEYPFLGVSTAPVTPQIADANGLDEPRGVFVARVLEGGPADGVLEPQTGFERVNGSAVPVGGDVVVAIDGESVRTSEDLGTYLVRETEPGETVTLTVVRDGERRTVDVTVGTRPDPADA